jgi:hypothetical protein
MNQLKVFDKIFGNVSVGVFRLLPHHDLAECLGPLRSTRRSRVSHKSGVGHSGKSSALVLITDSVVGRYLNDVDGGRSQATDGAAGAGVALRTLTLQ